MSVVQTLNDIYFRAIKEFPRSDAYKYKEDGAYRDLSREAFAEAGAEVAMGLVALGMERGDRVAILSPNRVEWPICDFGMLSAALVTVPVYVTLTATTIDYIMDNSGARAIFVSSPSELTAVLPYKEKNPDFRVILFEGADQVEGAMSLDDLRSRGRDLMSAEPDLYKNRWMGVSKESLATIIYTSGTTGTPKGVMLTHDNIVSNVLMGVKALSISEKDTSLSFLPLCHILERMAGLYVMTYAGSCIAYAESIDTVRDNLLEVRPTVMVSVPRLYEKMYARVLDAALSGGGIKKKLFLWAKDVGGKRAELLIAKKPVPKALEMKYRVAKQLVFSKLKARTGGRLRFMISGGAPLAKEIADFFFSAGLNIFEGYGLTESSPLIAVNTFEDFRPGTVGKPVPGVQVRIADDGEILAKGPSIMKGYFNMPEATAETLRDGWLYTGDIGRIDEDGFLVITDRKKDLIITAGGKNVAPQPIENKMKTDKYLQEVVVLGDRRPYLVALVVPDFENLAIFAEQKGLGSLSVDQLTQNPKVNEFLMGRVDRFQRDIASFESIKRIHVLNRELSIEDGELTPTLKVKRKEIQARFGSEIEALYAEA